MEELLPLADQTSIAVVAHGTVGATSEAKSSIRHEQSALDYLESWWSVVAPRVGVSTHARRA